MAKKSKMKGGGQVSGQVSASGKLNGMKDSRPSNDTHSQSAG